jgi:uroporphyrin-III C-methyltransferase
LDKSTDFIGKVFFVGAGPGEAALITVKGLRILQQADIILHDRLVAAELLGYAKAGAEIIYVGKECKGRSVPQSETSQLIVDAAMRGLNIVRLKGGDISFFSNIFHELEAVSKAGIAYEIVPGVTSASACGAYAGIPLTARGYADAVRFLTLHRTDVLKEKDWDELAANEDTLVWYMSGNNAVEVVQQLMAHGKPGDTPIAVIEQGATPKQQVHISTFADFEQRYSTTTFSSPSLLIAGRVVLLHERFNWYKQQGNFEWALPGNND